ncbi:hypothetical protein EIN_080110 [Entamoeba invadens IP1]|uniref:hypothetical protein n=1 Tax=Entamoeba invadens IP1 TaxID=370355 RepID=UPI0002C3E24A|nr:hypothetical protein EIN_080110 [Entamoeba invadens IP1]ELP85059.1 hypothetical protein EIN_080110 [Entamoeba invadens IP1]|eukprot:XP_004184405.1 hypothetical protein EIN_080110 [Entamoeba invadens IP1]
MENELETIENLKEFKPILQQKILDKELMFMEQVRQNNGAFKELDSNLSMLIKCVESLKERVIDLSEKLNQTFTGFQALHSEAKKINTVVEQDKHSHLLICSLLTKCIPPPELIQRLLTKPVDDKYAPDLVAYHSILQNFEEVKEKYKDSSIVKLCMEYHTHTTNYICQRIYDVVASKLNQLSQSNPIILQHHLANNYAIHFRFLMRYAEEPCNSLKHNHMETMKALFYQYFTTYTEELMKLRTQKALPKTFEFIEYIPKDNVFKACNEKEKDSAESFSRIKTRIDVQRNVSNKDDEIIIPIVIQTQQKETRYELETIIDSLYRVLFDTVASHVDCYSRIYRKIIVDKDSFSREISAMVEDVFGPIFQYFITTIIEKNIVYQNLDSFTYFIYLREFVNCQNFIDKNYVILNDVNPLRDHLNKVTQMIISKVYFILNNTIIFVQSASGQPKNEKSLIRAITRKYAQYDSLLQYVQVIHYYSDLEELCWKFRTTVEQYIIKMATFDNKGVEIPSEFTEVLNFAYIACFLKHQDNEFIRLNKGVKDLTPEERKSMNADIFSVEHSLEVKREHLSGLINEKFFFFLLETLNRVRDFETNKQSGNVTESDVLQFVEHLRGFMATFKEKWIVKLKEMMVYTQGLADIKEKDIEYWEEVQVEIGVEFQRGILKFFLNLCEEFDKKLKSDLLSTDIKLELMKGCTTFAAIYAEVAKYMEAIKRGIPFSSLN